MKTKNFVYFDLETQKSAQEVGGWHNKHAMRLSVAVTYSTGRGRYRVYHEDDVHDLLQELQRADCVIGFNIIDFDFEVLAPYSVFDLSQTPSLDLLHGVEKSLGRRIGLDAIAHATCGVRKTASGLEALRWWKEGRVREIAEYCCYDVKATKLVHEYGAAHGKVFYQDDRTQRREPIAVQWAV